MIKKVPIRLTYIFTVIVTTLYVGIIPAQNIPPFSPSEIQVDGQRPFRITSVIQDKIGNICLSSDIGLIMYDGFESWKVSGVRNDTTYFNERTIEVLFCDKKGQIWIGNRLGLARYDPYEDRLYRYSISPESNQFVLDITEESNGDLWMVTGGAGLFHYDQSHGKFSGFLNDRNDSIHILDDYPRVILCDQNNVLWIGTGWGAPEDGKGLVRFDPQTKKTQRFLHDPESANTLLDNRVTALYEDQSGQILVGTYQCGLHKFLPESESFKRLTYDSDHPEVLHAPTDNGTLWGNDKFVQIIHQDRLGGYWIGTTGVGLAHFADPKNPSGNFSKEESGFVGHLVWAFLEDRQSNLWVATLTHGMMRRDRFEPQYREIQHFSQVVDLYQSPFQSDIIWIGTFQGLYKWNFHTDEITHFLKRDNEEALFAHDRDIFQENDSILWIGLGQNGELQNPGNGRGGLVRLNQNNGSTRFFPIFTHEEPAFHHTVFCVDEDHDGHLWLSTGRALFRSNRSKTDFEEFTLPPEMYTEGRIYWMSQKGPGRNYWIMTSTRDSGGTLYRYDYEQEVLAPFLEGHHITTIIDDDQGSWWMTTLGNGILRYDTRDSTYEHYTVDDGLPSNEWLYLLKDSSGILWTNSLRGLARIDPKTRKINALKHKKTRDFGYRSLGGIVTSYNHILLELYNRIVSFQPEQIGGNLFPPDIKISQFQVADSAYHLSSDGNQNFQFNYEDNDIHIEYTGIHYSDPKENVYRYQLEPVEEQWIEAGTERNARYTDLKPGDYTFRMHAGSSNDVWTDKALEIPFRITPPWWKTWWAYILFAMSFVGGILGISQYRSHTILKDNKILESKVLERTHSLEKRSQELNASLENLQLAQQQLIQSEKLASLGELTAGIAHEIQNPLNFVNNFSEIGQELLEEIVEDIENENQEEALHVANELHTNISKILHHGKRADSIVKSMLLHSRSSSSQMVPTDINKLMDEYWRLAYHGLRSRDKTFNAEIETTYDRKIESTLIDPAEFGRVVLNLISNAFYAVHERFQKDEPGFKPLLQIVTKDLDDKISVIVKDNGPGIPEEIRDKIFQPFFSTKPTGEGTGLGLSLAFDTITKVYQGEIRVESEEGVGTAFQIILPKP